MELPLQSHRTISSSIESIYLNTYSCHSSILPSSYGFYSQLVLLLQGMHTVNWLYYSSHLPVVEYPSCLQATCASNPDQKSSHTVPQVSFQHTSTRPSYWFVPPTSLMSPFWQSTEWMKNFLLVPKHLHKGIPSLVVPRLLPGRNFFFFFCRGGAWVQG